MSVRACCERCMMLCGCVMMCPCVMLYTWVMLRRCVMVCECVVMCGGVTLCGCALLCGCVLLCGCTRDAPAMRCRICSLSIQIMEGGASPLRPAGGCERARCPVGESLYTRLKGVR